MQDEYANRLSMFRTSLNLLNTPERKTVWHNQPPVVFTTKVTEAGQAVTDLEALIQAQSSVSSGATEQKAREEAELEDAAHVLGSTLSIWFRDQGDEANAAQVEQPISAWRRMRHQQLLEKARTVRDLANSVVTGPSATAAADYSLNAAAVTALSDEIDDYAAVITAPQQTIAERKALTLQLRERFATVETKFVALDSLILRYNTTPAGRALIDAFQQCRTIRDLGHGPSAPPSPPPPIP